VIGTMERTTATTSTEPPRLPQRYRDLVSGRRRGLGAFLQRGGLRALSLPYGLAVRTRNWLFDHQWIASRQAAVPVVCIGNLTLGGTGKTPAVEYVARFYRQLERRVAILSRGYGSTGGRNDEAMVLEENLPDVPHLQGMNRVSLARIAVAELESELLVLDDGFQHRRLQRDLDIVLIDATEPWGYGRLFPRGMLREPPSSLRRADLVLLTRCDQVPADRLARLRSEVRKHAPAVPVVESIHAPVQLTNPVLEQGEAPLVLLDHRPVAAFCGIGNPAAFQRTVEALTGTVTAFEVFPDHHNYHRDDVDRLRQWAREQPADAIVVTTQKDLVKLRLAQLSGRPLWAVRIALRPTVGQDLLDHLLRGVVSAGGLSTREP
jgi:tetraacyldisaccharide 4'-kinase